MPMADLQPEPAIFSRGATVGFGGCVSLVRPAGFRVEQPIEGRLTDSH